MNAAIDLLLQLLHDKNWMSLKHTLREFNPVQLAEMLMHLSRQHQVIVFRLLPRELAKETFTRLSRDDQKHLMKALAVNTHWVAELLNDLEPDDRAAFFEELPGEVTRRLLQLLTDKERAATVRLLGYPEDSIGRLMTTEYVAVRPQYTVQQALEHIRKFGRDSETLNVIYVVDDHWKLIDDLRIKEILLADPERVISGLCDGRFTSLNAHDDQEVAARVFLDHNREALPVTDAHGTLLGIVTVDDVMDVVQEEHTEDFHRFGGTEGLDLSYTQTPLATMVRKRAGWLMVLFLSEMLTASAMGHFEKEITKAVVLALFVPLIISSGGNSGSQAASLIIRSLALHQLTLRHWWYVMRKEILSGLLLGAILGAIGFVRIGIWQAAGLYDYGVFWPWIGVSVSVSLIFVVLWGTFSGSMIPFLLQRAGLDPAAASAPFVATLVDVTGLVIYFLVAALFLSGKLL